MTDTYRGWRVEHTYPPIPTRIFDWTATHPDYDGAPEHSESGPADHRMVHGETREECEHAVDEWLEEQAHEEDPHGWVEDSSWVEEGR